MTRIIVKEWSELISDPIGLSEQDQRVFDHNVLPSVKDEVSVTLRLNVKSYPKLWGFIFIKGSHEVRQRTPSLSLTEKCTLYPRYSSNKDWDLGTGPPAQTLSEELQLNRWYHIAVTVSDIEKRLDLFVDGIKIESGCIAQVIKEHVEFNEQPFSVGHTGSVPGFNGQISNVRYFNWRLSAEEVKNDSLDFGNARQYGFLVERVKNSKRSPDLDDIPLKDGFKIRDAYSGSIELVGDIYNVIYGIASVQIGEAKPGDWVWTTNP
ncbi:5997_t:CDS:2 [Diversispora eburnea]|uniref:5997_t:CDS:1 n=1 Tax=Diversispora eburnea TaxID=1213867 RepID=A0A9N9G708_9GLOM|nr:5997_t:CDS:2 [Diversispora eburnea]